MIIKEMKYIGIRLVYFISLLGCVETDIEEPLEPLLLIKSIEENTLHVTEKHKLEAIYTDDSGDTITDVSITWASSDPSILRIDEDSAIGVAPGMVMVSASVQGAQDSVAFEVLESRESIQISIFREVLMVGATSLFEVNYTLPNGDIESPITPDWSSSDESVASVAENGLVSALKIGVTVITASHGHVSDQVTLMVTAEPVMMDPEVRMTTFVEFMREGDQFQFEAQYYGSDGVPDPSATLSWGSSDVQILAIDQNGLASALAAGQATITASFGNVSAVVDVEVESTPSSMRTGTLKGRGYSISGSFTLEDNNGILTLIVENYMPDGPGPYFYLSNSDRNVNNGLELGDASRAGRHEIVVSEKDPSVQLHTYRYLVVWCKPFSVTLGYGEFSD